MQDDGDGDGEWALFEMNQGLEPEVIDTLSTTDLPA